MVAPTLHSEKVNFKDSDDDRPVINTYKMVHQHLAEVIERLPAVEPELDIVRCKDCKHRYGKACDFADFWIKDDDYCSRGERKE